MTPPQMTPASEWLGQCYTANYPEGFLAIIERAQAEARAAGWQEAQRQALAECYLDAQGRAEFPTKIATRISEMVYHG